jgi:hypothetical protein
MRERGAIAFVCGSLHFVPLQPHSLPLKIYFESGGELFICWR